LKNLLQNIKIKKGEFMKKKVKNKKNSVLKKYYELLYAVSEKYPG